MLNWSNYFSRVKICLRHLKLDIVSEIPALTQTNIPAANCGKPRVDTGLDVEIIMWQGEHTLIDLPCRDAGWDENDSRLSGHPTTMRQSTNAGAMLGHRRRRWPNIDPALLTLSCFPGKVIAGDAFSTGHSPVWFIYSYQHVSYPSEFFGDHSHYFVSLFCEVAFSCGVNNR